MACLQSLPAEILILIATHIQATKNSLTPLATTSKHCQTHIEPLNFWQLTVRGSSDLQSLSQKLTERRFSALRILNYEFDDIIPLPDPENSLSISEVTLAECSVAFTRNIQELFQVLEEKSQVFGNHPGIELKLRASRKPAWRWSYKRSSLYLEEQESEEAASTSLRRAWLKPLESNRLPVLPIVTSFRNHDLPSRLFEMIWPGLWTELISSSFPNLKKVCVDAAGNERKDARSRYQARKAFAHGLGSLPSGITDATVRYLTYPPADQFFEPPNLTDSQLGYDIFSHELVLLSQRLVRLTIIDATVDVVEFFNSDQTEWPKLEVLDFSDIQIACADGTWYFNMDPRVDEYEGDPQARTLDDMRLSMGEDEVPAAMDVTRNGFRLAMDKGKFKDVYVAAAKATRRMPKLRKLQIEFDVQGDAGAGPGNHAFHYFHGKRGTEGDWYRRGGIEEGIKVGWGLWPAVDFSACEEVLEAWRDVGKAKGATIELYAQGSPSYRNFRLIE